MEVNYNKTLYKIFLIVLKYVPFVIGMSYLICIIVGLFGNIPMILPSLFYLSPVTAAVWICASFVFKCCIWHRLPIYYTLLLDSINTFDVYSSIQISASEMLFVYLIITLIFILLGMYFKNKYNVKRKHVKTSPS